MAHDVFPDLLLVTLICGLILFFEHLELLVLYCFEVLLVVVL